MIEKLKSIIPWQLKILLKIILSRVPLPYSLWSRLGIFKHGRMDEYHYAWSVLNNHIQSSAKVGNLSAIEFGPGDGVLSALLAKSAGLDSLDLLDAGDFASKNIKKYKMALDAFAADQKSETILQIGDEDTFDDVLKSAKSKYYTKGLESLRKISAESYDLIFSQAVLEHIRVNEFEDMLEECHRLLKPNGVMSHVIDFKDHLGGGLNNLRFDSAFWEKDWFAFKSGFYTNRLRLSDVIHLCNKHNFRVKIISTTSFSAIPVTRSKLAPEFKALHDDDLMCSGAHLIMEKYE